jgi:hypothetical protein
MRPEAWYEVIRPSLSDRQGGAMFIGTPKGRNHFYDLWAQGYNSDDWESFQYTTLEGGNVPQAEIEAARQDLDERTFKQEYEAAFVTYAGLIYYGFSREESVLAIDDDSGTLHIGMDFNLDPMSAVICIRKGGTLIAVDEMVDGICLSAQNASRPLRAWSDRHTKKEQAFQIKTTAMIT